MTGVIRIKGVVFCLWENRIQRLNYLTEDISFQGDF